MDGDLPLYSIADSNLDLEFMMDSEINRILVGSSPGVAGLDPSKIPFQVGQNQRYGLGQKSTKRRPRVVLLVHSALWRMKGKHELTSPSLPRGSSYHLQRRPSLPPYPSYTEVAARFDLQP
ncbi:hypothetical protein SADUNF_Sadunf17G0094500 [Salix dunnii]|uniref:Uncharacterized protein n=1 Tax=Salix dunnii TaxID=1413687 RepID=A0A835MK39_9ROSI|nr:hypothetical protein SADUNF_Sadunf17G0094500 [Salix dunnii]